MSDSRREPIIDIEVKIYGIEAKVDEGKMRVEGISEGTMNDETAKGILDWGDMDEIRKMIRKEGDYQALLAFSMFLVASSFTFLALFMTVCLDKGWASAWLFLILGVVLAVSAALLVMCTMLRRRRSYGRRKIKSTRQQ
jgi:hypothetical protein